MASKTRSPDLARFGLSPIILTIPKPYNLIMTIFSLSKMSKWGNGKSNSLMANMYIIHALLCNFGFFEKIYSYTKKKGSYNSYPTYTH